MTTPFERKEALKNMNQFLMDAAYLRKREERLERIGQLMRHYPTNSEIDLLFYSGWIEEIWGKKRRNMGKKAMKYPDWICNDCGKKYGHVIDGHVATFHLDKCGWCKKIDVPVTQPRDWGFPQAPK